LVKIRTLRYQYSSGVIRKMILTKNWWFWQSSPRNFRVLKISRVFRKCVNLWRVNLWRKTVIWAIFNNKASPFPASIENWGSRNENSDLISSRPWNGLKITVKIPLGFCSILPQSSSWLTLTLRNSSGGDSVTLVLNDFRIPLP